MGETLIQLLIIILICLGLLISGFIKIYREKKSIDKKIEFANKFIKKFQDYIESNGEDSSTYTWLINRSTKMQRIMGRFGLMDYKPPFQNYYVRNHSFIVNFIPEIKREFRSAFSSLSYSDDQITFYIDSIQEAIIRYNGFLEDIEVEKSKELKNPFVWLNEGIGLVLRIPLEILRSFKLLSGSTVNTIIDSFIFKVMKLIAFILGLVSAIITISLGWDNFVELIFQFL